MGKSGMGRIRGLVQLGEVQSQPHGPEHAVQMVKRCSHCTVLALRAFVTGKSFLLWFWAACVQPAVIEFALG